MDRASGSGVFARDPDALLDLIELEVSDAIKEQEENKAVCKFCMEWIRRYNLQDQIPIDDQFSQVKMLEWCRDLLKPCYKQITEELKDVKTKTKARTAWRIEGTLREFKRFEPVNLWFDYPVHHWDHTGVLKDINPEDAKPLWKKASDTAKKKAQKSRNDKKIAIDNFIDLENYGDQVMVKDLMAKFDKPDSTIRSWVKQAGYSVKNGYVVRPGD